MPSIFFIAEPLSIKEEHPGARTDRETHPKCWFLLNKKNDINNVIREYKHEDKNIVHNGLHFIQTE